MDNHNMSSKRMRMHPNRPCCPEKRKHKQPTTNNRIVQHQQHRLRRSSGSKNNKWDAANTTNQDTTHATNNATGNRPSALAHKHTQRTHSQSTNNRIKQPNNQTTKRTLALAQANKHTHTTSKRINEIHTTHTYTHWRACVCCLLYCCAYGLRAATIVVLVALFTPFVANWYVRSCVGHVSIVYGSWALMLVLVLWLTLMLFLWDCFRCV